jgi:hypothetical protein
VADFLYKRLTATTRQTLSEQEVYMFVNKVQKYAIISALLGIIVGCGNSFAAELETPCAELIKKNLINPETFKVFDITPLTSSSLDVIYKNAKSEEDAGVLLVKMSCIETYSAKCINAVNEWKDPIAKHRSVIQSIDDLKAGGGDIKVFKLRTKAEGKLGNKITSFSLCAVGNGKVFVTELDN